MPRAGRDTARQVARDLLVPALEPDLVQAHVPADRARVVDDHVQAAECFGAGRDDACGVCRNREVTGNRERVSARGLDLRGDVSDRLQPAAGDHDGATVGGEGERGGPAIPVPPPVTSAQRVIGAGI